MIISGWGHSLPSWPAASPGMVHYAAESGSELSYGNAAGPTRCLRPLPLMARPSPTRPRPSARSIATSATCLRLFGYERQRALAKMEIRRLRLDRTAPRYEVTGLASAIRRNASRNCRLLEDPPSLFGHCVRAGAQAIRHPLIDLVSRCCTPDMQALSSTSCPPERTTMAIHDRLPVKPCRGFRRRSISRSGFPRAACAIG